jgi:hypothetical protein
MAAEDRPLDAGRLVRDLVPAGRLAGMPRICLCRLPLQFHRRCAAERNITVRRHLHISLIKGERCAGRRTGRREDRYRKP